MAGLLACVHVCVHMCKVEDEIVKQKGREHKTLENSAYPYCKKMRTLRLWPSDLFIKRLVWMSHLNRSQELYCSRQWKNDPKDDSGITRAPTPITGPECMSMGDTAASA